MASQHQNSVTGNFTSEHEGETVRELVRRHLTDQSHKTTDEELKNAKLTLYTTDISDRADSRNKKGLSI